MGRLPRYRDTNIPARILITGLSLAFFIAIGGVVTVQTINENKEKAHQEYLLSQKQELDVYKQNLDNERTYLDNYRDYLVSQAEDLNTLEKDLGLIPKNQKPMEIPTAPPTETQ